MECEAELEKWVQSATMSFAFNPDDARDLAERGIRYAETNAHSLTHGAKQLWGLLHYRLASTYDDIFKQCAQMDKAILVCGNLDRLLGLIITQWFQNNFVPYFDRRLHECRFSKEKPEVLTRCFLRRTKLLESIEKSNEGGRLLLCNQRCALAKVFRRYDQSFPLSSVIAEYHLQRAEIYVKLGLYKAAKIDVDEVFGYGETLRPQLYHVAATVEINRTQTDDVTLRLKRHETARLHIISGLKEFANDEELERMKTYLDEEIERLEVQLSHGNQTSGAAADTESKQKSSESSTSFCDSLQAQSEANLNPQTDDANEVAKQKPGEKKKNQQNKNNRSSSGKRKYKVKEIPRQRSNSSHSTTVPGNVNKKVEDKHADAPKTKKMREPKMLEHSMEQRKAASGGEKQKKKSKRNSESKASVTLFQELSPHYSIHYGCETCVDSTVQTATVKPVAHRCLATKLLLQDRRSTSPHWIIVRPCPANYNITEDPEDLCEHLANGEICIEKSRCPKPHSAVEKMLWNKYFKSNLGFSRFMEDLRNTSLRVKNELARLCLKYEGKYAFICGKCLQKGETGLRKKAHNPECSAGHSWNDNRILAFERTRGGREIIQLNQEYLSVEAEEIENCLKEMLKNGFTEDEVADESIALNQRQTALVRNAGKSKKKRKQMKAEYDYAGTEYGDDEDLPNDALSGDNEYDTDLEDILTVIDSDEEYQNVDTDDEREESFPKSKEERDLYYHMMRGSDLLALLENEPEKYKRCTIHLEGPFRAECRVLDNTSKEQIREIIVSGRMNCGPTVEGDEVVVEVKSTEVLDSKEEEIETQLKPEIEPQVDVMTTTAIGAVQVQERQRIVTRGTVRGIIRKKIYRKGYTFVCRVDNYHCHLMKPLDGVAPKLNVKRKNNNNDSVAVFEKKEDGKFRCKKIVKMNPLKKVNMLFLVKYQRWDHSRMYPQGYVTHIIHTGETFEQSQHVLNILHQVPTRPSADCEQIATGIEPAVYIENDKTLEDGRNLFVISVDPPHCKDVDDALSVEKLRDGAFRVGVHIADVTSYVEKDDAIDRNARRRTTSYYAATGKVFGMLPTCLAENVCSLRENLDRLVLSVFFRISGKGQILPEKTEIRRMIIRNRKQLTYEEAESYIDKHISINEPPKWAGNDLECTICHLHYFAVRLRESRIRDGQFFYQTDDPFASDYPFESHRMIEELMLLTNRHVGCFLESKYPGQFPVRVQKPPNDEDIQRWKVSHPDAYSISFFFRQFSNLQPKSDPDSERKPASLLISTVTELLKSATNNNMKQMKTLIGLESEHPLHHLALVQWYRIQERAEFKCSSCPSDQTSASSICIYRREAEEFEGTRRNGHFSLQLENYVQFTSPIRRFMDIIIHRFVKAALEEGPAPYTSSEVQKICDSVNKTAVLAKKYGKCCSLLKTTDRFQEPFRVPYVVERFDDGCIGIISPYMPHIKHSQRQIKFSELLVNKNPDNNGEELTLSWERRFYDAQYEKIPLSIARTTNLSHETLELDSERHSANVSATTWKRLQQAITCGNILALKPLIQTVAEEDKMRKQGLLKRLEITSEMKADHPLVKHHVKFKQVLSRGAVLKIQVGRECLNGFLQPVNQLLQLTDDKDICLEHRRDPIRCFAKLATESVATSYESVEHYHSVWLPIIAMEAATQTVAAGDAIYCSNVPLSLIRRNETYYGTLKLPLGFCRKRQIKIYNKEDEEDDCNDYMCIRHKMAGDRVWVAHVVSTKKEIVEKSSEHESRDADENILVELGFKVQQYNGSVPDVLLQNDGGHCGIEFLTKSLPDRRMEEAMKAIDSDTNLCNRIVLKRSIPNDPDIILVESDNYDLPQIGEDRSAVPPNNHCQRNAIRRALAKPFTLIQGPPGTGKTVTGVKLVYWFATANKQSQGEVPSFQILYCGPSNNAVDVAASKLKKFVGNSEVKMIRVYSAMLEKQVYPIPRDASQICHQKGRRYDMAVNADHNDIALHNLIRKPHNDYSKEILKYDELFRRNINTPENVTDEEVENYLRTVTKASIEELRKYDVIFCTCAASASKKMKEGTNVRQIIIDESGMCMEPESLIPLVGHPSARQVVLIGDHKQLQPIVTNTVARDLGMQKSLFERYEDRAIMLEEQYRMHPSICEFPSRMFYDGRLTTAPVVLQRQLSLPYIWPNRSFPCTVFIHVEGAEKTRSVSTEEGNQQSKSNEAERDEVQRIFLQLVNSYRVPPEEIAILSQYKAQCSEIEKNLKSIAFDNPFVSTVVASQGGEWPYVFLSLVRSLPEYEIERNPSEGWKKRNMGFIVDRHQINVALTRAKIGLIIVGNKNLLRCDEMWRELLDHYQSRGCIRNVGQFLRSFRPQRQRRR